MGYISTGSYGPPARRAVGQPRRARRAGLGDTLLDKQDNGSDFIATWFHFKQLAGEKFDVYRDAKQGVILGSTTRHPVPMFTSAHARVINAWLVKVGQKAIAATRAKADNDTDRMESAVAAYKSAFSAMGSRLNDSFHGRMPLASADEFVRITEAYSMAMSGGQWMAFNDPTRAQMMKEALEETPGGSILLGIADAALFAGKGLGFLLSNFGTVLKVAIVGGVAYGGYRLYKGATR